jgi:signal peptidase I
MPGLNGSLTCVEIGPLVRLLSGLGKSGDVVVSQGPWTGRLLLDAGQLLAASVADSVGLEALEFIGTALRGAEFEFHEGSPGLGPNLELSRDPLAELERFATGPQPWIGELPSPYAVPHLVESAAAQHDVDVVLGLVALYVLTDVDGRRNVLDLVARHGLLRTLKSLNRLRELGVISVQDKEPGQPPASRASGGSSPRAAARVRQPDGAVTLPAGALEPVTPLVKRLHIWELGGGITRGATLIIGSEILQAVLLTAVLILGVRSLIQNFRVEGVSMQPAFEGGQVLLVNRAAYFHVEHTPFGSILHTHTQGSAEYVFDGPRHGDVAVFRAPPQPDTDYIKRIIALPGESVLVRDGQLYVEGARLVEPYVEFKADYDFPEDGTPFVVPDGFYFVLGDNRPDSYDSHAGWLVPTSDLIGRVWLRYWPPQDVGIIEASAPTPREAVARDAVARP